MANFDSIGVEQARKRKAYTVLLEYLGEYRDQGGVMTYMAHVTASCVDAAVAQAQAHCRQENDWQYEDYPDANLPPLLVLQGFNYDLLK